MASALSAGRVRPWRRLSRTTWIDDPWLTLHSDRCEAADGTIVDPFHVVDFPHWSAVAGLTAVGELVLVEVYRHPLEEVLVELPAGAIDPGETPAEAARREFREETGYGAGAFIALTPFYPSTGRASGIAHPFLAYDCTRDGPQQLEPAENLAVFTADFVETLADFHRPETPTPGVHLAMLHAAARHILKDRRPKLAGLRRRLKDFLLGTDET